MSHNLCLYDGDIECPLFQTLTVETDQILASGDELGCYLELLRKRGFSKQQVNIEKKRINQWLKKHSKAKFYST